MTDLLRSNGLSFLGRGKEARQYYESQVELINAKTIDLFKKCNVEVVTLTDAQYETWIDVARKSDYPNTDQWFAARRACGDQLAAAQFLLLSQRLDEQPKP